MGDYRIDFLVEYSEQAILEEIRRVAGLLGSQVVTRTNFDAHSRVASSTVARRFGGWQQALEAARLGERYSGQQVTDKMRSQRARTLTNEEIVCELKRVAGVLGTPTLRVEDLDHSDILSIRVVTSRFGSWRSGLQHAGLQVSNLGKRWSLDQYFENLMRVWDDLGRRPSYADMDRLPSEITAGGYEHKFGSWRKALHAFVEWVGKDGSDSISDSLVNVPASVIQSPSTPSEPPKTRVDPRDAVRKIPLRLRFRVLERDCFSCRICGRSRAKGDEIKLQVDHVIPWSRGGRTDMENLQALCEECNLGKSNLCPGS